MFWNRRVLYKGNSKKIYNEIINILKINNIKYNCKIESKNSCKGPLVDKMIIGTLSQREDFSFEYIIFVNKNDYESVKYLINNSL
ncbi:hypothetical protein ABFP60_04660 [Clostridioides difficile]